MALCVAGHFGIAEMLVNAGADLLSTSLGRKAHDIAIEFDNQDIADLIIERV